MSVRRSTTSGVPRPLVLRPLAQDNGGADDVSRRQRSSSSGATDSNQSMLSSPKNLIEKYGFRIITPSSNEMPTSSGGDGDCWSRSITNFYEPDHLRTLAIVAMGEGVSEDEDQCAFINRDYLALWNSTLASNLLRDKKRLEEVAFPGPKEHLDALLRCIWPSGVDNWPLTMNQLKVTFLNLCGTF